MSLSGHQSPAMKSDSWLTPPEWIEALGPFDLDPCCPPSMPWRTAKTMLTKADDGLASPWEGRVWLNPPFGREAAKWLEKLADHNNGIALIPARTETAMFYDHVWARADAVCFVRGRPHFHYPTGERAAFNSGAPIALVAYGLDSWRALRRARLGIVLETLYEYEEFQSLDAVPYQCEQHPDKLCDRPIACVAGCAHNVHQESLEK